MKAFCPHRAPPNKPVLLTLRTASQTRQPCSRSIVASKVVVGAREWDVLAATVVVKHV